MARIILPHASFFRLNKAGCLYREKYRQDLILASLVGVFISVLYLGHNEEDFWETEKSGPNYPALPLQAKCYESASCLLEKIRPKKNCALRAETAQPLIPTRGLPQFEQSDNQCQKPSENYPDIFRFSAG